uniref:Uncharacterized protein n=1 Tax=Vibrio parahaemolyticus TaxID=670 RepID=A0A7M1VMS4_VIBPH|nr:hypothetical protein VP52_00006 [Vibrio parahaemolyticus]
MHGLAQNGKREGLRRVLFMVSKFSQMRNSLVVSDLKQDIQRVALNKNRERLRELGDDFNLSSRIRIFIKYANYT